MGVSVLVGVSEGPEEHRPEAQGFETFSRGGLLRMVGRTEEHRPEAQGFETLGDGSLRCFYKDQRNTAPRRRGLKPVFDL